MPKSSEPIDPETIAQNDEPSGRQPFYIDWAQDASPQEIELFRCSGHEVS